MKKSTSNSSRIIHPFSLGWSSSNIFIDTCVSILFESLIQIFISFLKLIHERFLLFVLFDSGFAFFTSRDADKHDETQWY